MIKFQKFAIKLILLFACAPALASQKALMIIDMQGEFAVTTSTNPIEATNNQKYRTLIDTQKRLIALAESMNLPIMVVELDASDDKKDHRPTNSELLAELSKYHGKVATIVKRSAGLFASYNPSKATALKILKDWNVTDLIVVGINGFTCVKRTIEGALENGFTVWTIPAAVGDFDSSVVAIYPFSFLSKSASGNKSLFSQGLIEVENPEDAILGSK